MPPRICIHSHKEVELRWSSLNSHVEIAALKVRIKIQKGFFDLRVVRHSMPAGKDLVHFLINRVRVLITSALMQQIGVASPCA